LKWRAFETELAGLRSEARTVANDVLTVAEAAKLLLEQALQPCLALDQLISGNCAVLTPFRNKRSKAKKAS
jgi:hypothetical protein